jgi:hypothetical protein
MPGMQWRPGCGDNGGAGRVYWFATPNRSVGKRFKQSKSLQQSNEACDSAGLTDKTGGFDAE